MTARKSTAELGTERLLRPGWNFEIDYDGIGGNVPVVFTWPTPAVPLAVNTPDLSVLDDEARSDPPPDGISPVLTKFVPVACGSTMLFFIPIVPAENPAPADKWMYVWKILFRWRSAADWVRNRRKRKAYQIGKTTLACPDTRVDTVYGRISQVTGVQLLVAGNRYLMPVTSEAIIYGKPEQNMIPAVPPAYPPQLDTILPDSASVPASASMVGASPLYPGYSLMAAGDMHTMDHQQGVLDPNFPGITPAPANPNGFRPTQATHLTKWIKSAGNEFVVEVFKFNYVDPAQPQTFTPRNWDFNIAAGIPQPGSEDYPFSVMFGIGGQSSVPAHTITPYTGVRVVSGLAPL
ncbi:MAG: hypothetical protein WC683_02370 [bacterium]